MNITPMRDIIVITRESMSQTSQSGLIIAPNPTKNFAEGVVVAIHPDDTEYYEINVNDKIVHVGGEGQNYKQDGVEYVLLKTEHILAVIK